MQRIVEQAVLLVPAAEGAAVELVVEGLLCYVCTAGSLGPHVGTRLDPTASLSGLAMRTGITQRCDDAETDPRVDRAACRRLASTSMICVPLREGSHAVGVLKVSARTAGAFSDRDVASLSRLARFVTTTITTARALAAAEEELFAATGSSAHVAVDEPAMTAFVANVIRPGGSDDLATARAVEDVLAGDRLHMALQPIVDLKGGALAGAEALARIDAAPARPPLAWFTDARRVGLGVELQLAAITAGLSVATALPEDAFVAVNLDAEALSSAEVADLVASAPRPVVLELTEHVEVSDYPGLRRVLARLRAAGARLAIDDTGAGYSSFSHIVKLAPEFIKLDIDLVRGVDLDPVRRSLVTAVVAFAAETGAVVIAEGIETTGELDVLRSLPVGYGQGFALGRPMAPAALAGWCRERPAVAP